MNQCVWVSNVIYFSEMPGMPIILSICSWWYWSSSLTNLRSASTGAVASISAPLDQTQRPSSHNSTSSLMVSNELYLLDIQDPGSFTISGHSPMIDTWQPITKMLDGVNNCDTSTHNSLFQNFLLQDWLLPVSKSILFMRMCSKVC